MMMVGNKSTLVTRHTQHILPYPHQPPIMGKYSSFRVAFRFHTLFLQWNARTPPIHSPYTLYMPFCALSLKFMSVVKKNIASFTCTGDCLGVGLVRILCALANNRKTSTKPNWGIPIHPIIPGFLLLNSLRWCSILYSLPLRVFYSKDDKL